MRLPSWLSSSHIPKVVLLLLVFALGIYFYGVWLLVFDLGRFRVWIREDGMAEWLTFAALIVSAGYAVLISLAYARETDNKVASMLWLFVAFVFLFGAMEEISYGQRIFRIETPDFLRPDGLQGKDSFYNKQGEINIHNLVICGVNLNKLVFGKILGVLLVLYLVVVPLLYRYNRKVHSYIDRRGIPIIQNYQLIIYFGVVVLTHLLRSRSPKANELLEFVGCFVFLAIVMHPFNSFALPQLGQSSKANGYLHPPKEDSLV
jgi:hypothetical protein